VMCISLEIAEFTETLISVDVSQPQSCFQWP